jgi:SEC-C motif-containing protein
VPHAHLRRYAPAAVPHAHHFLERLDRVTREQMEFALGLYRDHEAVHFVLGHLNLPPATERVALALDDAREGPFVLVTLDGHFVTCLGKGMRHDHPVVPRGQVDALLAKVADKRARRELAQRELRPDEDEDDLFQRVFTRGSRLSREDFIAVSSFEPTLGAVAWHLMLEVSIDVNGMRLAMLRKAARTTVITRPLSRALEGIDRFEWGIGHLMLLSCACDRSGLDAVLEATAPTLVTPSFACMTQGGLPFWMRSAWAAARLGRAAIPKYRDVLAKADGFDQTLEAALGLGAIALRHAGAATEVRRILASYEKPRPGDVAPETAPNWAAHGVLHALENASPHEEAALEVGQRACVSMGAGLPEDNALRFTRHEDVPESLARTAALTLDADAFDPQLRKLLFIMLPVAAAASAEDFYYPRDVVRAWHGAWQPEEALERLTRLANRIPKSEPVRIAKTPGRNEPCSCGSGKKWKRCHGMASG